ncbi:Uncharacterised protein [Vibrio cholerae]|nr:Uncharacterised protein [Vibrio cholerae]
MRVGRISSTVDTVDKAFTVSAMIQRIGITWIVFQEANIVVKAFIKARIRAKCRFLHHWNIVVIFQGLGCDFIPLPAAIGFDVKEVIAVATGIFDHFLPPACFQCRLSNQQGRIDPEHACRFIRIRFELSNKRMARIKLRRLNRLCFTQRIHRRHQVFIAAFTGRFTCMFHTAHGFLEAILPFLLARRLSGRKLGNDHIGQAKRTR